VKDPGLISVKVVLILEQPYLNTKKGVEMISILSLWLPILLSSVLVFLISSLIHMLFKYHDSDYKALPDEGKLMDELRRLNIPAGDYIFPRPADNKEMNSKEFQARSRTGPSGILTIFSGGSMNMAPSLVQWFVYTLLVGIFAAYVAGRALEPGAYYLSVFRFTGVTAFAGYSLALMQQSIWYKKDWNATLKSMFDGLIYALLTAGVFGWLWPAV
jgi:hypothetical protein